jgi:UDP-N-acetylmuramoylalanine--D-glutamate ligase
VWFLKVGNNVVKPDTHAGGIKKQEDYSALFELIDNNISNVVLIGQSAKELGSNIHTAKVTYANSMEAAVNTASILIDSGAILLSPACASFDMFDDFEQRGWVFKINIKGVT